MALNLINIAHAAETGITATKNCPATGVYPDGTLLQGIPCNGPLTSLDSVVLLIRNLVNGYVLPLVGTVFVIMVIVGGIMYVTSSGNPDRAKKAKQALTAAIVGLIIVILSYTLIAIFASALGGGA